MTAVCGATEDSNCLLIRLQAWYSAQTDGEWEHRWGIRIHTLDNPGWLVRINLEGTPLAGRPFPRFQSGSGEADTDWMYCQIDGRDWVGAGGADQLLRILSVFLTWADQAGGALAPPQCD